MGSVVSAKKRERIIIRDRGCCQLCGYYIHDPTQISIDHKVPKSRKGKNTYMNLWLAHKECNHKKGSKILPPQKHEYPDYVVINPS